jgi:hypothetical protein
VLTAIDAAAPSMGCLVGGPASTVIPSSPAAGPDMVRLWQQYPPRAAQVSWPATEQDHEHLLARVQALSVQMEDERPVRQRRRPGLVRVLDWLAAHPGDTWQQRWVSSGADSAGNDDWWKPLITWWRPGQVECGVSTSSTLRVCALMLIGVDAVRSRLEWVLTPRAPQNLVPVMATVRGPEGFAEMAALCDASPAGRTMKTAALRRAATILAVKGGTLRDITIGDCLELSVAVDQRTIRRNRGMGFYQLLHTMGVFGDQAPATARVFDGLGQRSCPQLIDRYQLACRPIRDVLVAYLEERRPSLDYTSLQSLAFTLGSLFWKDLERHHPGIDSLRLPPEVSTAWKQRVRTKTRTVTGSDGQPVTVRQQRESALGDLATVRAFYLDVAQWAMEDPARWAPWAAACPIRSEDLARQKNIRARKSRTDQRTRERLPVLPALSAHVYAVRVETRARLEAATATCPGQSFPDQGKTWHRPASSETPAARVWGVDPDTGRRRDLTGEEDRAFWTWAAVETLRHTGIRIEELTELSHHSLVQYALPGSGQVIPLLQI